MPIRAHHLHQAGDGHLSHWETATGISQEEVDELFRALGEYAVAFQWLEATVRRIDGLLVKPRVLQNTHLLHRDLMFGRLIDATQTTDARAYTASIRKHPDRVTGLPDLLSVLDQCKAIAEERNDIVHATYDGLEAGGELVTLFRLRTPRSKKVEPRQHVATADLFTKPLANVVAMAIKLEEWVIQLTHWPELEP